MNETTEYHVFSKMFQPPVARGPEELCDLLAAGGAWRPEAEVTDNHQRLVRVPLNCRARGLRLVPLSTWGAPDAHVFAFDAR